MNGRVAEINKLHMGVEKSLMFVQKAEKKEDKATDCMWIQTQRINIKGHGTPLN